MQFTTQHSLKYFSIFVSIFIAHLGEVHAQGIELAADLDHRASFVPSNYYSFDGQLIFAAEEGIYSFADKEMWRFNPNDASFTYLSSGILRTELDPGDYLEVGDKLFFSGSGPDGRGLYLLEDRFEARHLGLGEAGSPSIPRAELSDNPQRLGYFDGRVFIGLDDEIWTYQISENTIQSFGNFGGFNPSQFTEYKGLLYFSAAVTRNGSPRLWILMENGSTRLVFPESSNASSATSIKVFENLLVYHGGGRFHIYDGEEISEELELPEFISNASSFIESKGKLYFSASTFSQGGLWSYDGQNISLIHETTSWVSDIEVFNGTIYFLTTSFRRVNQLWRYNPSGQSESLLTLGIDEPGLTEIHAHEDFLYFDGWSEKSGIEPWRMDSNRNFMQIEERNYLESGGPGSLQAFNNGLYFTAVRPNARVNSLIDSEWSTLPEFNSRGISSIVADDDHLYFFDTNSIYASFELRSLGRMDRNGAIEDLGRINFSRDDHRFNRDLAVLDDEVLFAGDDGQNGLEIWRYSPSEGLGMLSDLLPGDDGSEPREFTKVGNYIYFTTRISLADSYRYSKQDGLELLSGSFSNATKLFPYNGKVIVLSRGRVREVDMGVGSRSLNNIGSSGQFTSNGYSLFYTGRDQNSEMRLWEYDGVNDPKIIPEIPGDLDIEEIQMVGDELCIATRHLECLNLKSREFTRFEIDEGREISPAELTEVNGDLYFRAHSVYHGWELWKFSPRIVVSNEGPSLGPKSFSVSSPFPNPSTNMVSFTIQSEFRNGVEFSIFDSLGRRIQRQEINNIHAGVTHRIDIDLSNTAGGLYVAVFRMGSSTYSQSFLHIE